jgi:hypothetical protein
MLAERECLLNQANLSTEGNAFLYQLQCMIIKGTVLRDFQSLVFFIKQSYLGP